MGYDSSPPSWIVRDLVNHVHSCRWEVVVCVCMESYALNVWQPVEKLKSALASISWTNRDQIRLRSNGASGWREWRACGCRSEQRSGRVSFGWRQNRWQRQLGICFMISSTGCWRSRALIVLSSRCASRDGWRRCSAIGFDVCHWLCQCDFLTP